MERTKRSVPGVRKWLRFEAGGRCGTLHADKYNITEETGVQVRAAVTLLKPVLANTCHIFLGRRLPSSSSFDPVRPSKPEVCGCYIMRQAPAG